MSTEANARGSAAVDPVRACNAVRVGAKRGKGEDRSVEAETADLLRAVLDAVYRGDMEASTPPAIALVRRMEGALMALEESARHGSTDQADRARARS